MSKKVAEQLVDMILKAGIKRIYAIIGDSLNELNDAVRRNPALVLLPKSLTRSNTRLQPFGEFSLQEFQRYGNAKFTYWSAGGNIYLDGHHARISFKYQTRPIVENNEQASSKGTFILATQVSL